MDADPRAESRVTEDPEPHLTPEAAAEALDEVAALVIRHLADRHGLSMTAGATLSRLESQGPLRLTVLAAAEGVAQPSMTQLVQRLERQGLATRVSDPDDGRVSLVDVTDAGRALLAERRRARRGQLAALLATLPEEDEQTLAEAMRTALPVVRRLARAAQARVPSDAAAP